MKLLNKTVWAITPEMLQTMMTIARQNNKSPEAVASQLGKEMKNTNAVSIRDGVAVIRLTGPLFRYANLFTRICGATSYELFAQDFNKALKAPSVQAILLDVDSPGGEVNGCSEVADMIYKARGTKPIIAYASGYCCSGAYWIASACDKIYATDTAVIGSIGVVSIFEKDDENKTIEIVSSQSPNKRPNVETEEGMEERLQAVVSQAETDGSLWHTIIHGTNSTTVSTENGKVPSVAKQLKDVRDELINGAADYLGSCLQAKTETTAVRDNALVIKSQIEELKTDTQEFRDTAESYKNMAQTTFNSVSSAVSQGISDIQTEGIIQVSNVKTAVAEQVAEATAQANRAENATSSKLDITLSNISQSSIAKIMQWLCPNWKQRTTLSMPDE